MSVSSSSRLPRPRMPAYTGATTPPRLLAHQSTPKSGGCIPRGLERKRLYPVLVSLQSILFTIGPRSTWALRLHSLLGKYQRVPLNALGMKANWDADGFWQEAFEAGSWHGQRPSHTSRGRLIINSAAVRAGQRPWRGRPRRGPSGTTSAGTERRLPPGQHRRQVGWLNG